MASQNRIGPLIAGSNGTYTAVMEDGSTVVYDGQLNQVGGDSSPNPQRASLMQSGNTDAAAATIQRASTEDARRFDAGQQATKNALNQRANESSQNYKVNMMNARTSQDQQRATAQYQQEQSALARDRLSFDRDTQQQEFGLKQANLGYNLMETGAKLKQNPNDYFLEQDWARGAAGMPQTSTFLSALQSNTQLPGFNARGHVAQSASLNGLADQLQGGSGQSSGGGAGAGQQQATGGAAQNTSETVHNPVSLGASAYTPVSATGSVTAGAPGNAPALSALPGGGAMPNGGAAPNGATAPPTLGALPNGAATPDWKQAPGGTFNPPVGGPGQTTQAAGGGSRQDNYLAQIGSIAQRGAHKLGAGALEQLTPSEQSLFTAGLKNLGYDADTFLSQYKRSRIGQNFSAQAA